MFVVKCDGLRKVCSLYMENSQNWFKSDIVYPYLTLLLNFFFFDMIGYTGYSEQNFAAFLVLYFLSSSMTWSRPLQQNIILSWVVLTTDHSVTFFPLIHTITLWIYMKKGKIICLCWVFKEKDNMTIIYTRTSCKYLLGKIGQWNFLKSTKIIFLLIKEKLYSEQLTVIVKDKYI